MAGDNNNFKAKSAEWQGYVRRALEDITKDVSEIKNSINGINKRVTHIQVKVAGIGASVSLVVTILILLIRELLAK